MTRKALLNLSLCVLFMSGCVNQIMVKNKVDELNEHLIANKLPSRYIFDTTADVETDSAQSGRRPASVVYAWAGEPGESSASDAEKDEVFALIQERCSLKKINFIETRVVHQSELIAQEVWLFQDPQSLRADKVSGLTVEFTTSPETKRRNRVLYGACHSGKGAIFH